MRIKLMRKVEHWRECGAVQDIIDRAEVAGNYDAGDYAEYDELIEVFSSCVVDAIEEAGHEVEWVSQQSRGVGCVVQGNDREADEIFLAAVEQCEKEEEQLFGECRTLHYD